MITCADTCFLYLTIEKDAMKTKLAFTGILFIILAFISCTDSYDICDITRSVTFQGGLYQKVNGVETVASAPNFSLSMVGASIALYSNQPNTSRFGFGLNPLIDSASYSVTLGNNYPADTVTLVYSSQSVLISPECGNIYVHTLLRTRTTYHTIDSVKIVAPAVNTTSGENLKIYF